MSRTVAPAASLTGPPAWVGLSARLPLPTRMAAVALLYVLAAKLGFFAAVVHGSVSAVWPPTGLALAVLLLSPRLWPGILLGAFLANALTPVPAWVALGIAVGNTLEAWAGSTLIRRLGQFAGRLHTVRHMVALLLFGALLAPVLSASLGVAMLGLGAGVPWARYGELWQVWWLGDALGVLTVTPLLLALARPAAPAASRYAHLETAAWCVGVGAVALAIFLGNFQVTGPQWLRTYVLFPPVIASALRGRQQLTALVLALVAILAIYGTSQGLGPFAHALEANRLLQLQLFIAALSVTGLLLVAARTEQYEALAELQQHRDQLTQRVAERTAHLQTALHTVEQSNAQLRREIEERTAAETALDILATHDPLTGLPNRTLFGDRLHQAIHHAERQRSAVWVVLIDLDHFKYINDSLGHHTGEQVLQHLAQRLGNCVRESDTLARLGGDEFALVLADQNGADLSFHALQRILAAIHTPLGLAGLELTVTASLGCAVYPQDGHDADTLLRNADLAMYRAKELGRDNFQFFTAELDQRIHHRVELETQLRQALERQEFELHYQPQVDLGSGRIIGVEALLRWRHPERGLVSPGEFIPLAEETGLIVPMGEWVLTEACRQNQAWQTAGLPALTVAVNLSARQLAQHDVDVMVERALRATGLPAQHLELELTESLSMAQPELTIPLMRRLKEMGVALAIDDFGTGYSNLSYLARFPVDKLKLDMSFVREMTNDDHYLAIATAVIVLAHQLRLRVIAEGVETAAQLALLASNGCDEIQGYYFYRPLPAEAVMEILQQDRDHRHPAAAPGALGAAR